MSISDRAKETESQAKAKDRKTSESKDRALLNVRPLPQNRPIAETVANNTDELMGYLD
ncbi:MAG TPA: hypothetical protein V6C91_02880 [Coleofasciculaceae cyanobacterium]